MRTVLFIFTLILVLILSVWLLMRMVINTDPAVPANVAVVLLLGFLASGCLGSLLSWGFIRQIWHEERLAMSLRHGIWGGLFLVTLPILRWLGALNLLVLGAVLLIILGFESLILLQQEHEEKGNREEEIQAAQQSSEQG